MKLKVLNSSSKSNCYVIENEKSILILEAGISFKEVKKAIDFNVSKIVGVLTSHEHGDHSDHVSDYLKDRIPVFSTEGTAQKYSKKINVVEHKNTFHVADFRIMPFALKHDVPCLGYLIKHPQAGTLLFCTDTYYMPYKFKGLNHILIEANYSKEILKENISRRYIHPVHAKRVMYSHMELQTTKNMLKANDLSKVVNIVLLHLSDDNSNARLFRDEIVSATGKMVYIADKGLEISLSELPTHAKGDGMGFGGHRLA
jgi:phosphoribosyl 1,2-cyclic phosphodiesterase